MGETRSRTTLDIRVNARQVNELERQLQRVFSPRALMDFDRSIRGLTRSIMDLNRTSAAGATTDRRWKDMRTDLRGAREEAAELTRQLRELQARQREMGGSGGAAAAGGAAGGYAGAGGYHGGGGRTGWGRNVASGVSRTRGLGQIPMPGVGAMATGFAALPGIGLLAAGSLMAAAGAYQSHLGYQQASMGAMPFLGRASAVSGVAGRADQLTDQNIAEAQAKWGPRLNANRLESTDHRRHVGKRGPRGREEIVKDILNVVGGLDPTENAMEKHGGLTNQARAAESAANLAAGGRDAIESARIAAEGAYLSGRQKSDIDSARGRAASQAASELADRAPYLSMGGRFGVKPQQALQEASQMSRAGFRGMSAQEYGFGLGARTSYGVDLATTGGLMGQLEYAGSSAGESGNKVAKLIGSAVARGLEASEIATYLQRTNQFLQQQTQQGRQVNMTSIMRAEEGLVGSGIAGWRAGNIAQQFAGAGAQVGMQGPQSAVEFRLMEAMGYTGKGGFEEYAQFRLDMQNPGNVAAAMPSFVSHINKRTAGQGPAAKALILQQYFSRLRTMLGPEEAMKLTQGMAAGGMDLSEYGMDSITESGSVLTEGLGGSLKAEAGLERQKIGTGAGIAGTMQNLAKSTNNLAQGFTSIAGPVMRKFTSAIERATDKLADFDSTKFVDEAMERR